MVRAMSTLAIVEEVLRESGVPLRVADIVARAERRLPSNAQKPDTVVGRDLSLHIRRHGNESTFVRTGPGLFTLRELVPDSAIWEAPRQQRRSWVWGTRPPGRRSTSARR
jgi:hypothetical protein